MDKEHVMQINCPGCNTQLDLYDVVCPWCGAKVEEAARFLDETDPRTREMRTIVEGAMAYALTFIANRRREGAQFPGAEAFLARAKVALANGDFPLALELASRSGQEAEDVAKQFDALLVRMGRAERKIKIATERGGNVDEALELLDQAKNKMEEGEYRVALKLAMRSAAKADRSRMMYDAWKVEVQDYL